MTEPDKRPTVVELFAGVGGFSLGLEGKLLGFDRDEGGWTWGREGGDWRVIWSNQWEPSTKTQHAATCYREQFPHVPLVDADIDVVLDYSFSDSDDIDGLIDHAFEHHTHGRLSDDERLEEAERLAASWAEHPLPKDFDLLVGGFPCQDYSVAKPLSKASGIVGQKGVLWWEIERIIRERKPSHVLLENVDRLLKSPTDQRGRDFAIMLSCLAFHGYEAEWRVINAAHYGFPQRRRRVFLYARHLDEPVTNGDSFQDLGEEALTHSGVMYSAFPCHLEPGRVIRDLVDAEGQLRQPHVISEKWPKRSSAPWLDAGFMRAGLVYTASVEAPSDSEPWPLSGDGKRWVLEDILLSPQHVLKDANLHEFLIPDDELGRPSTMDHQRDVELGITGTWKYLKGAKSVPRGNYHYQEGPVSFPEPLDQAARTVLTGEGGRSPSRFKLAARQEVPPELLELDWPEAVQDSFVEEDGATHIYRRLTPIELERLNMFEDGWTIEAGSDGRRAFCMGNALVVGIVQQLGEVIAERAQAR